MVRPARLRPGRGTLFACGLALSGLVVASCGGHPNAASSTSSTLPPLPPAVVGLITLIGSGTSVGTGTSTFEADLSAGPGGSSRSIATGTFPDAVAIAPNGKVAYVTSYSSNTVTPIELRTGRALSPIKVGDGPAGIAITPNGRFAYVTDAGTTPIGDTVTPINLKTDAVLKPITVGDGPQGIAITPDGSTAYVADGGAIVTGQSGPIGHTVTPIDLSTNKALAPINVGNGPIAVAVSSDGSTAYVANSGSESVTPISTSDNTVGTSIAVSGSPDALAAFGGDVYVADASSSSVAGANNLTPIDVASGAAGTPIPLAKAPTGISITSGTAYVVANGAGEIEPVDLSTGKVESAQVVSVPGGPYAIATFSIAQSKVGALFSSSTQKGKKSKKK